MSLGPLELHEPIFAPVLEATIDSGEDLLWLLIHSENILIGILYRALIAGSRGFPYLLWHHPLLRFPLFIDRRWDVFDFTTYLWGKLGVAAQDDLDLRSRAA